MKRGKDEEKSSIGPMFPRLHVNDAGKGGPRAPPRNKMALYEQLTIPSNRYNSGVRPRNTVTITNTVASASTSQGISRERSMFFPSQQPSIPPSRSADRVTTQFTAVNSRLSAPQTAQTSKPSDDIDFMVPVFSQQEKELCSESIPAVLNKPSTDCNEGINTTEKCGPSSRQSEQEQDKDESTDTIPGFVQAIENAGGLTRRDKTDSALEPCTINHGHQDNDKISNLELTNSGTREVRVGNSLSFALLKNSGGETPELTPTSDVGEGNNSSHDMDCSALSKRKQLYLSLPEDNVIRADDVSETAAADPVVDIDITPDDVVAVIGLKQFWKARRAIANQQRLFAIQVFELHRLIKVQKLIAESPELLIKSSSAFISRRSLEAGPTPHLKKLRTEVAVNPTAGPTVTKHKEIVVLGNNQNKIKGGSAVVPVPSKEPCTISSPQTVSTQPLAHPTFPANSALIPSPPPPPSRPPAIPPASDLKMVPTPWPFPQTASQQWLVPVMSPSEGLIYKPYPAHALPGCGGCGPTPLMSGGLTPLMGNPFIHQQQACGILPPSSHQHHHFSSHHHHHQGMGTTNPLPQHVGGVLPYAAGHNYFPPFKMPPMISSIPGGGSGSAVDQMNYPFSGSNLNNGDAGQAISGPVNPGAAQQRGSCNDAGRRRQSDMLGSTASSPSEKCDQQGGVAAVGRTTTVTTVPAAQERGSRQQQNALNLFPTTPLVGEGTEIGGACEDVAGRVSQVIRVVPHNARTAPESVARIFQCIQEERRQ